MDLPDKLRKIIRGEVYSDAQTLDIYSKDASIFVVKPNVIVAPKDTEDIKALVKFVNKQGQEKLSITVRSAGTCMSGGPINNSIILDMTKHFNSVLSVGEDYVRTQPGIYYRDFEIVTLRHNLLLPCYTSSREINTVGGMVGNNSAGELTLSYGQTKDWVKSLKVILSDGKEYIFKPLSIEELRAKLREKNAQAQIYRKVYQLIYENFDAVQNAKPKVSKNSTGYLLWDVWDGKTFDMTKIIVGSQGTLGIVTEIEFKLIPPKSQFSMLLISLNELTSLDQVVNNVLEQKPESFECFDNQTLKFAVKFLMDLIKDFKKHTGFQIYLQFLPEILEYLTGSFPKLVLMAQFSSDDKIEVLRKAKLASESLSKLGIKSKVISFLDSEKYWIIRRDSFKLLKQHAIHMHASPFIDDIIVDPKVLSEFLPKLNEIFNNYKDLPQDKFVYTIAGHIGNGNFHIVPLMDLTDEHIRSIIPELSKEVFDLVFKYGGSMAAEHNDGLVRGPYLPQMYGENIYQLFKKVKDIFDPNLIFNPHKKTDATFEYSLEHIAKS